MTGVAHPCDEGDEPGGVASEGAREVADGQPGRSDATHQRLEDDVRIALMDGGAAGGADLSGKQGQLIGVDKLPQFVAFDHLPHDA